MYSSALKKDDGFIFATISMVLVSGGPDCVTHPEQVNSGRLEACRSVVVRTWQQGEMERSGLDSGFLGMMERSGDETGRCGCKALGSTQDTKWLT